jgi:hypothetical protein
VSVSVCLLCEQQHIKSSQKSKKKEKRSIKKLKMKKENRETLFSYVVGCKTSLYRVWLEKSIFFGLDQ